MTLHNIPPVYDENSRILILDSFPSVKSREQQFFYGHKQNRFWKVLAGCTITGSADASIRDVVANDLSCIMEKAYIKAIYANGGKSYELYQKYIYPKTKREIIKLPSTSPANAGELSAACTITVSCDHVNRELRNQKDATITEAGYMGDSYCVDCGDLVEAGSDIPKLIPPASKLKSYKKLLKARGISKKAGIKK